MTRESGVEPWQQWGGGEAVTGSAASSSSVQRSIWALSPLPACPCITAVWPAGSAGACSSCSSHSERSTGRVESEKGDQACAFSGQQKYFHCPDCELGCHLRKYSWSVERVEYAGAVGASGVEDGLFAARVAAQKLSHVVDLAVDAHIARLLAAVRGELGS